MEEQQITLQIDHHFITVPAGTTLLEAARKIGIDIPTLCHINLKGTCIKNNPASCRICHCLNVRTMWQQWLIGIRILQKDLTGHFRTEEHVCRGKNAGSYCSQVNM